MAIEDIVDQINRVTAPDYVFDSVRGDLENATRKFTRKYSNDPVQDEELEDIFADMAKVYLTSVGVEFSNGSMYAQTMRDMINNLPEDQKQPVKPLIKKGDIASVLKLFQDAYLANIFSSEMGTIMGRIGDLDPGSRDKIYAKIGSYVGSHKVDIAGNLPKYMNLVIQRRQQDPDSLLK